MEMTARLLHFVLITVFVLRLCHALDQWRIRDSAYEIHSNFEVDEEKSMVLVTTTNSVFRLSMDLSRQTNMVNASSGDPEYDGCLADYIVKQKCQNYHNVLVRPKGAWSITGEDGRVWNASDTVLTCGSNAFSPRCHYRNRSNLESIVSYSSTRFQPFDAFVLLPSLWTSTGRLVVAAPVDDRFSSYAITMSDAPFGGNIAATTKTNQRLWFNKTPEFVSMYEIDEFIYFFFREESVEQAQVIYSRVARICKNDTGMPHDGSSIFTTFIKARMSCSSREGSTGIPYHYNEVYGTYYQEQERRLYAVFQSPKNGPLGSVVCTYTFGAHENDLQRVFRGKFLAEIGENRFVVRDNFQPFTCTRPLSDALEVQLMKPTATQSSSNPVFAMQGHAFQKIVADTVNGQEVLFISALRESDGALLLLKVLVNLEGHTPTHHVISTTTLPLDSNSSPRVTKMELQGSGAEAYLYVGTATDIYRVPMQTCSSHSTCCACVAARDPYCAYDNTAHLCAPLTSTASVGPQILQDVSGGNTSLCLAAASTTGVDTPMTSVTVCSGGVAVTEVGVVIEASTSGTVSGPGDNGNLTVVEVGLNSGSVQEYQSWIIVGTVVGFVGGVGVGVVILVLFKRFGGSKRNKRFNRTSCDITNPTKNTNVTVNPNKVGGASGSSGQPNQEVVRINNSMTLSCSNNLTRSGNDYSHHPLPAHLKEPPSPVKYQEPPSPVKNQEPSTPVKKTLRKAPSAPPKNPSTAEDVATAKQTKCLGTPSPPPPPSLGYKSQSSIFTFTPSSVTVRGHSSTPRTPPYSKSVSGASTYSAERPQHTDPNLQLNYKARVYLTNQQRETYGSNILARMPSVDGSKSKYLVGEHGRNSRGSSYSSDSLPRLAHHQDNVQLDTELGCSQC